MDPVKTGQVISSARKKLGLTQKDLSSKLFVSDKAVSKWERGLCFPDISVLIPLAEILNVNLYDLLKGEIMEEEKIEETIKNTIEFSNKLIKKNRKRNIILSTFIISLVVILSLFFIFKNKDNTKNEIITNDKILKITEYVDYKTSLNSKDGSNIESILSRLPLNYPSRVFDLEKNIIIVEYNCSYENIVKDYKNEIIVKKSMIISSLTLFTTVDDLDFVIFKFEDKYYKTNRNNVKKIFKVDDYNDLLDLDNWNKFLNEYLSSNDDINNNFKKVFTISEN